MQIVPYDHQYQGADFLVENGTALLADEPRVGKTGAAIMAADNLDCNTILVVTTVSGRAVWRRAFDDWSDLGRAITVVTGSGDRIDRAQIAIVGWPSIIQPTIRAQLLARRWDVLISDEDHFAKSFGAKRTQSLYGQLLAGGVGLDTSKALCSRASLVWCLTGTPLPHSPADMYPRLRALQPERLLPDRDRGFPDVTRYEVFLHRYCIVRQKRISTWRSIPVVIGGRNLEELRSRIGGFMLRRTQADVGITQPVYELLPLMISASQRNAIDQDLPKALILEAADHGDTRSLDMHLGPLRRLTGSIKAGAVVEAVIEEFACGLDRIVLAYWHRDVGRLLLDGLANFGVTGIDGATPGAHRANNIRRFERGDARVFLAQIEAAGESVDLSASSVMWFVETVFSPRAMKQMSLRITNLNQKRQPIVRVCVLEDSIDEAVQASLLRLWTAISAVVD